MGVNYINEKQEYIVFCLYLMSMNLLKLDTNYQAKVVNEYNDKCSSLIPLADDQILNFYSASIIYNKNNKNYYALKTCPVDSVDTFKLLQISDFCSELNVDEEIIDTINSFIETTLILPTTILNPPPTTVIIPPTTILNPPTTVIFTPTTIIIPPTTLLEKSNDTTLSYTQIQLPSTILT